MTPCDLYTYKYPLSSPLPSSSSVYSKKTPYSMAEGTSLSHHHFWRCLIHGVDTEQLFAYVFEFLHFDDFWDNIKQA